MSADNWTACSNCLRIAKKELERAYGKISKEEYEKLQEKYEKLETEEIQTFSEYYEQGISQDGKEYSCSYGGSCDECGFSHNFKHTEKTEINNKEDVFENKSNSRTDEDEEWDEDEDLEEENE